MLKNYIKIALRNMGRQKIYTMITMSGLVLGLSVFILFALISDSISNFDTFHDNAENIYAVVQILPRGQEDQHSAITPAPLVPALIHEYPEIEKATRFFPAGRMIVKHQDKIFYESGVRFVDPDFLSIFSFDMKTGDKEAALSEANSIVITESSALKYFGNEDPLGKTLTLDNKIDVKVTGITEDNPNNSTINYDFLVSMKTAQPLYIRMDDWSTNNQAAFLLLSKEADTKMLEEKFSFFIDKYYQDTHDSPKRFYLHSLLNFFLGSEGIDCYWGSGRISYVTIWIVAVLLLIIACINFMNISTARYNTRAHEVGMRKVVGANRSQLIKQFLGESILMSLISLPAAVLLYDLIRPIFAANLGSIFDVSIWDGPHVMILIFVVTILTGFFAGSYPAFYLSAFKPVSVFQKKLTKGKKGSRIRKILVVVQFTFSILLILITGISIKQSRYNLKVDLGYNRNNIIAVSMTDEVRERLDVLKNELSRNKDIISIASSTALPIEWDTESQVLPEGVSEEDAGTMNSYGVDYGFIELLDIKVVLGRSFSRSYRDIDNFILNETALRHLHWEDPIGKQLVLDGRKGTVIGVAKDFHFKSIYIEKMSPAVLYLESEDLNYLLVKFSSPEKLHDVTEFIRDKWSVLAPDLPFESITLENAFFDMSQGDKTAEMTGTLGALAIFLSCLGLFGLSSYSVERRVKEIGIRKVMGASISGIVGMLTKEFMKLVAIANIIAIPIAYFMMNAMVNFIYAYPIKIGAGIFIITAVITLMIAFITVSSQTIKSAVANPVKSLKYE